jgi:subtilisin-like proprotein convertase family protein
MNLFSLLPALVALSMTPVSAAVTQVFSFSGINQAVPDGNPTGLVDARQVTSTIDVIQSLEIRLDIEGSYNGDLYAYIQHGSALSVLVNRIGSTSSNSFGVSGDGMTVTLTLPAVSDFGDIHLDVGGGSPLVGRWEADGRFIDPDLVIDTDPRNAGLDQLVGLDPDGEWRLFVADLSSGRQHTLKSWELSVTGVPEPASLTLLLVAAPLLARRRRRRAS